MLIQVGYVYVHACVYGIAQLHHNWNPLPKGVQAQQPRPTGLAKHLQLWSLGNGGLDLLVRVCYRFLANMFLCYCDFVLQTKTFFHVSDYQWGPFEIHCWSYRMLFYFYQICSNPTLKTINIYFLKNIKFDQI